MIQKEAPLEDASTEIILLTHSTREADIQRAIRTMRQLANVRGANRASEKGRITVMQYVSTRGGVPAASYSEIVLQGLARDGGLFVPKVYPQVSKRP